MGIGFKGGFAAFMDGYNKAEQQNYTRMRQEKEDAWLQSQRDAKLAEQKRDEELRTKLSELSPKATEQVDNFVMAPDANGSVPAVKVERTKTQAEQLEDLAGAYQGNDPAKALELKSKADALRTQDYQDKFIQFRASAQSMPLKAQVETARQIFNDAPNPGMIGEPVWGADGSVTFDAVNKATGQKVRKTFSDPIKLIDDIHAFIAPKSYQGEVAARTKRAQELEDAQIKATGERDKFVWQEGIKAEFRGQNVGGIGGKPVMPKIAKNANGETTDEYTGATLKVIPGTPEERPWFGDVKPATPTRKVWVDVNDNPIPGGLKALYPQLPSADGAAPSAPNAPGGAPKNTWNDTTGEVISNGRVIGKAKSPAEARALLKNQPPAAKTGATNAGERAMSDQVAAPMGADPQAIAREIQMATADLQKVSDPTSVAELRQYIASLQGQLANIKG